MNILKKIADLPALNNIPQNDWGQDNITNIIRWAIAVAGLVAVFFIVLAGYQYTTSQGDPGKTKKALHTIIYASIGLVIVIAAEAITFFIFDNVSP